MADDSGDSGAMMKLVCAEALLEAFIAADRRRPPVDAGLTKAEATISAATKLAEWGIGQVELAATTADCEHLRQPSTVIEPRACASPVCAGACRARGGQRRGARCSVCPPCGLGATTCVLPVVAVAESTGFDERQLEVIRRLGDEAQACAVRVALEPRHGVGAHERSADMRSMCYLVERVSHPNVRLAFDTGRFACANPHSSLDIALQRVLPWLGALRLGDHSGSPGDESILPPGDGAVVDGCRLRELLTTQRYNGPVVMYAQDRQSAEAALRDGVGFLRKCAWRLEA
ncbi:MAG: TIM barrel protein [Pirellulales bacterium]